MSSRWNRLVLRAWFMIMLGNCAASVWAADFRIEIQRTSASPKCVTGKMTVDQKLLGHTIELPWKANEKSVSCIPPGSYEAILRYDKSDHWRIQLKDVPGNREGIQIHMGNHTSQIEGCILVGKKLSEDGCSIAGGTSKPAYEELKERFYGSKDPVMTPDKQLLIVITSPLEGKWTSTDGAHRWRFEITGNKLNWVERAGSGEEFSREVEIDSMSSEFTISRPNDDPVLKFLGFSEDMRREILARKPEASFMKVTVRDGKLNADWSGLVATKTPQDKFKELKQPGTTPAKPFAFERP